MKVNGKIPKFKTGDRVKVLIGLESMIGKSAIITNVVENDKDFIIKEGEEFIYFINGEPRFYAFEHFFEFDKEYYRDKKINEIMGYHNKEIPKGTLGEFSKIREEFMEAEDAIEQDNSIMLLVELSDLIGAIESYCEKNHKITLENLITMNKATKKAFNDGTRTTRN